MTWYFYDYLINHEYSMNSHSPPHSQQEGAIDSAASAFAAAPAHHHAVHGIASAESFLCTSLYI
jgi:hypothetical protein